MERACYVDVFRSDLSRLYEKESTTEKVGFLWCNKQSGRRYANYVINTWIYIHIVIVLDRYCFFFWFFFYKINIRLFSSLKVESFIFIPFCDSKAKLIKGNYQIKFIASERIEVSSYRIRIPWQYDALRHSLNIGLLSMCQPGLLIGCRQSFSEKKMYIAFINTLTMILMKYRSPTEPIL